MFNKPAQIGSTTFAYGPEHQRFKQVNGSKVTYYIGGDFEEVRDGTQTTQKAYIDGIALYSKTGTTGKLQYLHYDHLGSVETITDEAGAIVSRMSFNPWGERQQADWKTGTPSNLNTLPTTSSFTGHEHLDQLGLIHMGGRVYDPQVGRFLSADLFVQAPHFSQSFNRYSYVFNNPLSYTDPSGYQTTCQATVCEEVKTFGYSDSGDSGGWMRSGSWNYHGMAEFDFGLTHVWGQTLIKSQENPLVLDFSQNTDQSMAVTMGMMEAAEAKEYKKLLREGMQSSMNGAGLSLAGRGGRMNDPRRGKLSDTGYDVAFVGYLLIGFDVANTITGIGAGPDTGILGMAILASRSASKGLLGNPLYKNALSQFKNTSFTNAGRAVTKHPEYFGFKNTEALRKIYNTDSKINKLAADTLKDIMRTGKTTTGAGGRYPDGWKTITTSDGRAASWHADGRFIGFRGVQ